MANAGAVLGGKPRGKRQRPDGYAERKVKETMSSVAVTDLESPVDVEAPVSLEKSRRQAARGDATTTTRPALTSDKTKRGGGKNVNGKVKGRGLVPGDAETSVASSIGTTKSFGSSQTDFSLVSPATNRVRAQSVVVQHNGRTLSSTFLNIHEDYDYNEDVEEDEDGESVIGEGENRLNKNVHDDLHGEKGFNNCPPLVSPDTTVSSNNDDHHVLSSSSSRVMDVAPSQPIRTPESLRSKKKKITNPVAALDNIEPGSLRSSHDSSAQHSSSMLSTMNGKEKATLSPKVVSKKRLNSSSMSKTAQKVTAGENTTEKGVPPQQEERWKTKKGPLKKFKRKDKAEKSGTQDLDGGKNLSHTQHSTAASSFAPSFGSMSLGGETYDDNDGHNNERSDGSYNLGRLNNSLPQVVDGPLPSATLSRTYHEPPSPLAHPSRSILKNDEEALKKGVEKKKLIENMASGIPHSTRNCHEHGHGSKGRNLDAALSGDGTNHENSEEKCPKNKSTTHLSRGMNDSSYSGNDSELISPRCRTIPIENNVSNSSSDGAWSVSIVSMDDVLNVVDDDDDDDSSDVSISSTEEEPKIRRDAATPSGETSMQPKGRRTHKISPPVLKNASGHWMPPVNLECGHGSIELHSDDPDDEEILRVAKESEIFVSRDTSGSDASSISDDDIIGSDDEEVAFTGPMDTTPAANVSSNEDKPRRNRRPRPRISNWKSPLEFESEDEDEKKEVDESLFPHPPALTTKNGRPRSAYDKNAEWYCGEDGEDVDNDASYCSDGSSVLSAFRPAKKSPVLVPAAIPYSEASMAFSALLGNEGSAPPVVPKSEASMAFSALLGDERNSPRLREVPSELNENSIGVSFLKSAPSDKNLEDNEGVLESSTFLSETFQIHDDDEIEFIRDDELLETSYGVEKKNKGRTKSTGHEIKKVKKRDKTKRKNKEDREVEENHPRKMKRPKSKKFKGKKAASTARDNEDGTDIEEGYGRSQNGDVHPNDDLNDDNDCDAESVDNINIADYDTDDGGIGDGDVEPVPVVLNDDYDGNSDEQVYRRRPWVFRQDYPEDERPRLLDTIFYYLPCIMCCFAIFVIIDIILVAIFLVVRNN